MSKSANDWEHLLFRIWLLQKAKPAINQSKLAELERTVRYHLDLKRQEESRWPSR